MRCVVTGASGFLGSWLVRQLLQEGHSVIVLMRNSAPSRRNLDWLKDVSIILGTLEDPQSFRSDLKRERVDIFFHLAWFGVTTEFRNHTDQISTNVIGSLRLWELARDIGCTQWIGVGSQAEYGPYGGVLTETLPTNPATAYGMAKLATGLLTCKMSEMSDMRHAWVRLLATYGPGDDPKHLIPSVIMALSAGRTPPLTKGEQIWDYVYVSDAVRALCRIAATHATGIFNLASGETSTVRNIVEILRDYIDPSAHLRFGDIPYAPDQIMHLEADTTRLREATDWYPTINLATGLRNTVDWWRANGLESAKYTSPR